MICFKTVWCTATQKQLTQNAFRLIKFIKVNEAFEPLIANEVMRLLLGRIMTCALQTLVLITVCLLDIMAPKDKQEGKDTLHTNNFGLQHAKSKSAAG